MPPDISNSSNTKYIPKIIIFSLIGAIIILFSVNIFFFKAPRDFIVGTILSVEEGTSLRKLSLKLQEENIIRSRMAFEAFVIVFEGEKHIVPGDYLLGERLPVYEIARRVSTGNERLPPIKVTVPEGFDINQIGELFSQKMDNFNLSNFLLLTKGKEGYLFPDTYFFLTTEDEEDVVSSMSDNFKNKISYLEKDIATSQKTKNEIITMASIIEEEAKGDSDREMISGILWKRISMGMPLQADAAPITYKEKGLPKNPISNPGLASIRASIYPKDSLYLFYLHDKEGNIHYARNFEEHKANKAKYLK